MTDLEKIQDQLEKAMSELKELNQEETQLAYDYIEYSNILVKNLILYGVGSSLSEKQRIDYEIKAKRKDKDKNLNDWVSAGCFAWVLIIVIIGIISWLGS